MSYISRDPFARQELHRSTEHARQGCDWCGSTRKTGKLYKYFTETDGGSRYEHKGLFCCKGCYDDYHS